jgi:hypothetical protein
MNFDIYCDEAYPDLAFSGNAYGVKEAKEEWEGPHISPHRTIQPHPDYRMLSQVFLSSFKSYFFCGNASLKTPSATSSFRSPLSSSFSTSLKVPF